MAMLLKAALCSCSPVIVAMTLASAGWAEGTVDGVASGGSVIPC